MKGHCCTSESVQKLEVPASVRPIMHREEVLPLEEGLLYLKNEHSHTSGKKSVDVVAWTEMYGVDSKSSFPQRALVIYKSVTSGWN